MLKSKQTTYLSNLTRLYLVYILCQCCKQNW